ncbi:MAG TPA: helix-turn-helix transcriptional regulator [Polyangia bacterium]|nr:helix-turn-helix transcriptional regulator [Polyangia bacterium]
MTTNTLAEPVLSLGGFLRDRRGRVSPGPGAQARRRTPGLRREEVAARAGVSVTWYTWLEQGRGGAPSDDVLERLARALELDATGREMLFLLAHQRPPPITPTAPAAVAPALQRVLDALPTSPALVKTPTWDIVAWNAAATAVLADYPALSPPERNVLRRLFGEPNGHAGRLDRSSWESDARFALAAFRIAIARAGEGSEAAALAAELHASNAEFRRLWAESDVRSHWIGAKRFRHPTAGLLSFDCQTFAVDAAEGLSLVVFTPTSAEDAQAVAALLGR